MVNRWLPNIFISIRIRSKSSKSILIYDFQIKAPINKKTDLNLNFFMFYVCKKNLKKYGIPKERQNKKLMKFYNLMIFHDFINLVKTTQKENKIDMLAKATGCGTGPNGEKPTHTINISSVWIFIITIRKNEWMSREREWTEEKNEERGKWRKGKGEGMQEV